MEDPKYLTAAELAARFRVSVWTLRNWRSLKEGPAWCRIGKRVFYRTEDVLAYEAERRSEVHG